MVSRPSKIAAKEHPDIALLDVVLPGIDGVEVLRQLKRLDPAIVVVMMSAYRVVERAVEAIKLGAYDYLTKPFHVDRCREHHQSRERSARSALAGARVRCRTLAAAMTSAGS